MPNLPTFNVTDEQAADCLDAWGSVVAYKQWLRAQITTYVRNSKETRAVGPLEDAARAKRAEIATYDPLEGAT